MHLQKLCDQFEGGPMCMFPPNFWHSGHPESSTWKVVALCLSKHMFYQHLLAIQHEELTTTSVSARIRQMIQCHRQDKNLESDLRRRDNLGLVTSNPATPTATLHSIAWSWFVGSVFNFMTLDLGSLPWAWVLRMCSQFSTCTKAHRGPKRDSFGHASLTWLDSKPPKRRCHVDTKSKCPRIWKRG